MSVNALLTNSTLPLQPAANHSGKNGQSTTDWLASLAGAMGGSSVSGSSAQLSDQMQALLTQLQAGNTVAPSSAASGSAASVAGATSTGQTPHGHHHHHNGSDDSNSGSASSLSMLQDIATGLAGNSASAAGSDSSSPFGTGAGGLLGTLQTLGNGAVSGIGTALQAYAALHGVPLAQAILTA